MQQIHCLKCKQKTEGGQIHLGRTTTNRLAIAQQCHRCGSKKTRFIGQKEMYGEGLLGNLLHLPGGKIPILGDLPLLGNILF